MKFVKGAVYTFCVVGLFLACTHSAVADQQDVGSIPPEAEDTCQNLDILMASNTSTGIHVILLSTEDANNSRINLTIAGHYLPPECRVNNHLCSILHFRHPDGTFHYLIPLIRGFVVLSLWDNRTDELPWKLFIDVTENCNPTKAFLAGHNRIIVACMDLQSRPKGILYFMNYNLLPNSTGNGWTVRRNTALPTRSEEIFNPTTVSEIIHVREQARCLQKDNLYFVDAGYVLHFPTSHTSDPEFGYSNDQLQNCMGYQSFEYHGNDNLLIRCSNNQTALYDSCVTGQFTYEPDNHIPYPCTNRSTIAYRNGTQLTFSGTTQQLPSGDISFGKCIQGIDLPVFVASSADGSLFITNFDGKNVTKITSGNCSNNDNMPCPARPVFSENEHVFGAINAETVKIVIVNVTEGCTDDPVIARIPIPFVPDLVSIYLGRGTYSCSCSAVQNTEPLGTTTQIESTPDTTQTEPTTTQTDESTESFSSPAESSTSAFHQQPHSTDSSISINKDQLVAIVLGSSALAVIILMSLTSLTLLFILVYKCSHLRDIKEKDPPLTMQSQQESIRRVDPQIIAESTINSIVDPSDGGSGRTTATASISESDEMSSLLTSNKSTETVPLQAQSGQTGDKTFVLSKGALPLNPTQFSANQIYENTQSRTADNKDKEDMHNKVHIFMAEDNNRES